jgi:predicted small secreted protein
MSTLRCQLLLVSFLLAACSNVVIGGGGNGASGGHGAGGSTGAGTVPPALPAVSLTRAQIDVLWDEYWSIHDQGKRV